MSAGTQVDQFSVDYNKIKEFWFDNKRKLCDIADLKEQKNFQDSFDYATNVAKSTNTLSQKFASANDRLKEYEKKLANLEKQKAAYGKTIEDNTKIFNTFGETTIANTNTQIDKDCAAKKQAVLKSITTQKYELEAKINNDKKEQKKIIDEINRINTIIKNPAFSNIGITQSSAPTATKAQASAVPQQQQQQQQVKVPNQPGINYEQPSPQTVPPALVLPPTQSQYGSVPKPEWTSFTLPPGPRTPAIQKASPTAQAVQTGSGKRKYSKKRKVSKRKVSKRKVSKRKVSKRKVSKRKVSKRKVSKRKVSKRN